MEFKTFFFLKLLPFMELEHIDRILAAIHDQILTDDCTFLQ